MLVRWRNSVGMSDHSNRNLWPLLTAAGVGVIGIVGRQAIGNVYGAAEAIELLEALSRAGLYLASAIATASATTMALMLTLIGLIRRLDKDFDRTTYRSVARIAALSVASLLLALLLLLAFSLPVGEFDDMPSMWFGRLYEALFWIMVLMVTVTAGTVVLIYTTLRRVVGKITPGKDV